MEKEFEEKILKSDQKKVEKSDIPPFFKRRKLKKKSTHKEISNSEFNEINKKEFSQANIGMKVSEAREAPKEAEEEPHYELVID